MKVKIEESWRQMLQTQFDSPYFKQLTSFVKSEYSQYRIFPPGSQIFSAFDRCTFDNTRVIILGQDPYHGPNQAHGLCFSVNEGIPMPPSLLNIFKEIKADVGKDIPPHGCLVRWAKQGVLLLNATLSVRAHQAGSHQKKGWESFTDSVIQIVSENKKNIVFLLWGSYAQKKSELIDANNHLILKAPHPSPLSAHRGFFGCQHFSKTNNYLSAKGLPTINW
ncbi:MAG: uracil-DNA glycosylase [Cyclobacteriaceae bacterium]